ncbi:MAG: hypothetical protein PHH77_04975 [Victivallaceae bacterium]|nr:hypothetical protein [Victivallaceae bacterium]
MKYEAGARKRGWSLIFFFTPLLLFTASGAAGNRLCPEVNGNCLWISYGELIKEPDGSVILPLKINYGEISGEPGKAAELENVRVVCTSGKKAGKRNLRWYELPAALKDGTWQTEVRSACNGCFTVRAEARRKIGNRVCFYSAQTSLVLFARGPAGNKNSRPEVPVKIQCPLQISFLPRFDYWPQTGAAVTVRVAFAGRPVPSGSVCVYDENFPPAAIMTGAKGECRYVPADDRKLNRKGKTAFKHLTAAAEYRDGTDRYIVSCTRILHRSRFANRRMAPGIMIFGGCAAGFLAVIIGMRSRARI